MRRVDTVKNKKMKNVKFIEVLDKKRLRVVFRSNEEIVVAAHATDYGYDSAIYIEEDSI
ncbi:hypothetical protein P4393_12550 [Bacillus subtilis]|nr:hypothetical protein [Bacillus subtilis]MED3474658.1 hypothetical protein [Bacillus subtilis]